MADAIAKQGKTMAFIKLTTAATAGTVPIELWPTHQLAVGWKDLTWPSHLLVKNWQPRDCGRRWGVACSCVPADALTRLY